MRSARRGQRRARVRVARGRIRRSGGVRPVLRARMVAMCRAAEGSGGSSEQAGDLFGRVADFLDRLFKLVLRQSEPFGPVPYLVVLGQVDVAAIGLSPIGFVVRHGRSPAWTSPSVTL